MQQVRNTATNATWHKIAARIEKVKVDTACVLMGVIGFAVVIVVFVKMLALAVAWIISDEGKV